MKTELVQSLTNNFEACAQRADSRVEFWLARDIQHLLGYSEWRNWNAGFDLRVCRQRRMSKKWSVSCCRKTRRC